MTARRNPPVDTSPSSLSDNCYNNPDGVTNEPARESGSLQLQFSMNTHTLKTSFLQNNLN
ncbi:hypothetical protein T02_8895 [Trichinella nativa]|uniref:Uncharacterized protein n=1 Tax=Trichinella nativa TaxID=6335 RepID=A0A0V1L8P8_9BILA|nr:hypothetical protein T02_8895 [Trichinella nativa]